MACARMPSYVSDSSDVLGGSCHSVGFFRLRPAPSGCFCNPSAGCCDPALPTVGVRWATRSSARLSHTLGSIAAVFLLHLAKSSLPLDFVLLGFVCSALPCVLILCCGLDTRTSFDEVVTSCRHGSRCPCLPSRSRGPNSPRLLPLFEGREVFHFVPRFFFGYARHPLQRPAFLRSATSARVAQASGRALNTRTPSPGSARVRLRRATPAAAAVWGAALRVPSVVIVGSLSN